jgi:hypothetical protein
MFHTDTNLRYTPEVLSIIRKGESTSGALLEFVSLLFPYEISTSYNRNKGSTSDVFLEFVSI